MDRNPPRLKMGVNGPRKHKSPIMSSHIAEKSHKSLENFMSTLGYSLALVHMSTRSMEENTNYSNTDFDL